MSNLRHSCFWTVFSVLESVARGQYLLEEIRVIINKSLPGGWKPRMGCWQFLIHLHCSIN